MDDFPQWAGLRVDLGDGVHATQRYVIPSPANPTNVLCLLFTPHDITVMFAVTQSHEHYDPDLYGTVEDPKAGTADEPWHDAYSNTFNEFVIPVIQNRLVVVHYDRGAVVTHDVQAFVDLNAITQYTCETWSLNSAINTAPEATKQDGALGTVGLANF